MGIRLSVLEILKPRASAVRPPTFFILPALEPPRQSELAILILADGNRRSVASGGYSGGARRVVSIAEHLARRPDVAVMVACILSPDNIAKRGDGFFFALHREFLQLGVEMETRGALLASGVRVEIVGDLGPLRARGGHAVALADSIAAVAARSAGVAAPALRLLLGVGYGRDAARELDVDLVLRTGMEEPGVLRLSGLQTSARIASCATPTLWPDVEPREVDEVIDLCKRRAAPWFAGGYGTSMIVDLLEALATADLVAPLTATIPSCAPPAALAAALARLYAGPLSGRASIAVEQAGDETTAPKRYGPREDTRHQLRIVSGSPWARPPGAGELLSVLAPGQRPPLFTVPDWLPLGNANVHACAATAPDIVAGIHAAQRFSAAHPPLRGSERGLGAPARTDREGLGDRFAARTLEWAESAGLLLPGVAWQRAAENYALTAFFIHFQVPTEWDEAGAGWEPRADLAARYMLLVAAGDEGIFDWTPPGEAPQRRWARLEASSIYLQGALHDGAQTPLPRVTGAALLATIASLWRELFDAQRRTCLPAAAASFRAGLTRLYAASLAEHRPGIASSKLADPRSSSMPPCIAARARALGERRVPAAADELRVLDYLAEAGSAVGAGLLFRAAALAAPAASVTSRGLAALDAAATLLDYHFRLANDLSGFLESPGGDRDPKENACTILVPRAATGAAREAAIAQALATCRRLAAWLAGEVQVHLARVAREWPSMGVILRRGVLVGRRVYELGHYTTVSRAEMRAILAEAEAQMHA